MQVETTRTLRLGVVGTGTLSAAVIEGLIAIHGPRLQFVVSPRSTDISTSLSKRYPQVETATDNQEVLNRSDTVFLGVRPQHLEQVVGELVFRSDHRVVSFVAGADLDRLSALCAPATRIQRVTPLPPIARHKGPIVIYPEDTELVSLFEPLGTVIVPDTAGQIMSLGYAGGLMASFFEMALVAIRWLENEGVPRAIASDYVMSMFSALGDTGLHTAEEDLDSLVQEHATPQGINERCLHFLRDSGWFDVYRQGIDAMKHHLEN